MLIALVILLSKCAFKILNLHKTIKTVSGWSANENKWDTNFE